MTDYMWRVQVVARPEWEEFEAWETVEDVTHSFMDRRPAGWVASESYVERFHTTKYIMPKVDKWYKSRSGASERAKLLRSHGFEVVVQRSAPLVWPRFGEERVVKESHSDVLDVVRAAKLLKEHGFIVAIEEVLS